MSKKVKLPRKKSYKVGDRVVFCEFDDDKYIVPADVADSEYNIFNGTVARVNDTDSALHQYHIEWDKKDEWLNDVDATYLASDLIPEAEFKAIYETMEESFKAVSEEIKLKMKDCAKLIGEAQKLAKTLGVDLAELDAVSPLQKAMDKTGWRSSSWSC